MPKPLSNPDTLVDSIFPGRYLPAIFLWVLLATVSASIPRTGGTTHLFIIGIVILLLLISMAGLGFVRSVQDTDVPGQLFLFCCFAASRIIGGEAVLQHACVFAGMTILTLTTPLRGRKGLPLGPSLLFIAAQIQIQQVPTSVALLFPTLIAVNFLLYFASFPRSPAPPIASLVAAALYITFLSLDNAFKSISLLIIAVTLALASAIYLYRSYVSRIAKNVNIHTAEDLILYALLLAALRLMDVFSTLETYFILTGYFFLCSLYYLRRGEDRAQFVSAAVVTLISLIPILHQQIPNIAGLDALVLRVLGYCMIGTSAAIFSQLYHSRLSSHVAKIIFVGILALLVVETAGSAGIRRMAELSSVAVIVLLSTVVLCMGCYLGHFDLHRPPERYWSGIISPRLLVSGRRVRRTIGNYARSFPFVGFLFSLLGMAVALIRRSFGSDRHLTLGHWTQTVLLALAFPVFVMCAQAAFELYVSGSRGPPPPVLAKFGLLNGYPSPIRVYATMVGGLILFSVGHLLQLAYMRLLAMIIPIAFMFSYYFLNQGAKQIASPTILFLSLATLFVGAHILARIWHTGRPAAGFSAMSEVLILEAAKGRRTWMRSVVIAGIAVAIWGYLVNQLVGATYNAWPAIEQQFETFIGNFR